MVYDKLLIKNRFEAQLESYDRLAVVQDEICEQLSTLIAGCAMPRVERALEVGAGTGFLTRRMISLYPDAEWLINDLVEKSFDFISQYTRDSKVEYCFGDAENMELSLALDLVVSASAVQWFDDTALFFRRIAAAMLSEGVLAISTFGPENFREIRQTTGEGLEYKTKDQLCAELRKCGFEVLQTQEYVRSLVFPTPTDVLRHIRATGVNSIRQTAWGKSRLQCFEQQYREHYAVAEGVTLTYHPILILSKRR